MNFVTHFNGAMISCDDKAKINIGKIILDFIPNDQIIIRYSSSI